MHARVERRQRKGNWTFQKEQRQAKKKKNCRGSIYLLRKYINHEQNGGRNMDSNDHSDETTGRMRKMLLDNGEKEIHLINWQMTLLSCVLGFVEGKPCK